MRIRFFIRLYWREIVKMLRLSSPIIVAQISSVLMGVTDNIMVGKLRDDAPLAAAAIANIIFILVACLGIGVFATISPLVAKAKSSGRGQECGLYLFAGMKLSISLGFLLTLLLLVISWNFHWFGQKENVESLAKSYLQVIAFSMFPMMFFLAVKHFSDGLGVTMPAMVITVVGLLVNVFFNWVLIYGRLGFAEMGLYGSGLSTLIARVVMACLMIVYVLESNFFLSFLPNILAGNSTKTQTSQILKLGIPSGLQYFFETGVFVFCTVASGWLAVEALAAHGIILSIATITYMIAAGVSFAGAISVGGALGIGSRERVMRSGMASILLVSLLMLFCSLILQGFGENIIALYKNNSLAVMEIAKGLLFIFIFYLLADGVQAVGVGILRGIGDVNIPTMITLFAYWIVGIPASFYLGKYTDLGVKGIWLGLTLGLITSAVLLTGRFFYLTRKEKLKFA
ncbi:MATE family efflux transporter [Raineya orbicola]|jgi:MATE family multidrug resistance protein|uniref:Multidrug-efflux transporter n=1 Tax=Raineya orbicola TaxID=2016530 RepID=A0A2N3III1_9BACT|nr:MATE family efflux transporter [Raineya orbicola]PKQ70081.1 matE: MATE efflux family protein [Raineya orbicola]